MLDDDTNSLAGFFESGRSTAGFSESGRSTPNSGPGTPIPGRKRKQSDLASTTISTSKSDAVLEKALDALEKCQDDAQIFGDFIASALRELPTVEKQQELKRALNRTLLDFQDAQARYQSSHIQPDYHGHGQYPPMQYSWPGNLPLISNENPNLNATSDNITNSDGQQYLNL